MRIAVLAWGSLIPHPKKYGKTLRIKGRWQWDGPVLPIEYARISYRTKQLTLVIYPRTKRVKTLWAYSAFSNLNRAIKNLREREGIKVKYNHWIGYVSLIDDKSNSWAAYCTKNIIRRWAIKKDLNAVIWTDLPENFQQRRGADFSEEETINYLNTLTNNRRDLAIDYVRETPEQVQTRLRPCIEETLGI